MTKITSTLKISSKMIIGFSIVAAIAGIIGATGIYKIRKVEQVGTEMYLKSTVPMGTLVHLAINSQKARVSMRGMMLDTDRDRMEANAEGVKSRYEDVAKNLAEFEKSITGETGRKELDQVKALVTEYGPIWQEVVTLQLADKKDAALEIMRSKGLSIEKQIEEAVRALIEVKITEAKGRDELNNKIAKSALIQTVLFSSIGVLLAISLGVFFARMITRPIREVVDLAETIADGNLTQQIVTTSGDETGQLACAMNSMSEQLNSLLAIVSNNSSGVNESAGKLTSTSREIASGAEEAARQAATVATAAEEMASTSMDIARNCIHVAEGARSTSSAAQDGSAVVRETVEGMVRIAERVRESAGTIEALGRRSDEIGAIIGTIEDIAEQTNLLALNAAIEAARAGEQGRGFAVVADEVRALAERTTKATKEIGAMIKAVQSDTREAVASMESGVKEVESGLEGAERSGSALQGIIQQVNDLSGQINQIATAAEEQTATTNEISSNIQQMTQVIHTTAKGANISAAAAVELSSLADELHRLVGRFRLNS
ncbi:putative methyl-accepting chemotaxis protein [Geobacter sp. OR-1]|uniref:methyl-accepting chemotaxis protein n=1 Tax=Geobacter sp. OR-1 TaxID=1266765 RepID=UPI0005426974|nr:methyl-accepting chemotaxis protein [Geobacter sp. OR-1]GAM09330.1 putative methyl-accepting chemotaxis protein [Geobacter sp. OR-1]